MFGENKPEHPEQVGAIDIMCNVNDVLEGILIYIKYLTIIETSK